MRDSAQCLLGNWLTVKYNFCGHNTVYEHLFIFTFIYFHLTKLLLLLKFQWKHELLA